MSHALKIYDFGWRAIANAIAPIVPWASKYVKLFGEDGLLYSPDKSPWSVYPLELCADPDVFTVTYIKPVQTGGTTIGEIALLYRVMTGTGNILYNWPTNDKATDRWDKYTERRIKACRPVAKLMPAGGFGTDRSKLQKGLIVFPHITYCQQGVEAESNLDSDSVGFIVNEEVHTWPAGRIMKAKGRQTRVAFPKMINISNAGMDGDQLHEEFLAGTQQHLEVKCPGCGLYHVMRTRWEDSRPDLGGLRYDSAGCKRDDGTFNYTKLQGTIFFQMPCGYRVENDIVARRQLCSIENIRYSEPKNEGALLSNRSLIHEAVPCHNINWLDLIQQKHSALRSLKNGDAEPWRRYIQERECIFYGTESIPYQGQIVVSSSVKKNRGGLEGRAMRVYAADAQRGRKELHQLSHFWLVIEDVMPNCNSQIVFEGLVGTDSELIATIDEHNVPHSAGVIDASWDTKRILELCYRNGLNAVMANASHKGSFLHSDKVRRWYSEEKPIHVELNMPPVHNYHGTKEGWVPSPQEPVVWSYNKAGLLRNHFFIRDHKANVLKRDASSTRYIERVIPGDVSEEFKAQNESWERVAMNRKQTNDDVEGFRKVRRDDHLLMCLAYIDFLKDQTGLLGDAMAAMGIQA